MVSPLLMPKRSRRLFFGLELPLASVVLGVGLALLTPTVGAAPAAKSYAVATESPGATREAAKVLDAGGNAIDAAVCAALVSGITSPSSSGMGGGGFVLLWSARDQRPFVIDFRETAPSGIDTAAFEQRPFPEAKRGQAVGVPGEVAGLFELHQRWGKLKWPEVVAHAVRVAELGFDTEPHAAVFFEQEKTSPLSRSAAFRSVYLPGGTPAKVGQKLRAPKLAHTLRTIAREGRRGFYEGPIARDIVKAVKGAGGALELTDLSGYKTVDREPLRVTWEGHQILTMPPPSAGGLLLAQTLGLFSKAELTAHARTPGKQIHLLAEAMRGSFADRMRFLSDPAFTPVDMGNLLSAKRLARRKARLAEDRTHTQPRFGLEESGTHHLITADQEGNWVSLTTTVNAPFGAKLVAEQTGIVLNNELEDFTALKNIEVFEIKENPNRPRPGARPVSSMSPTLVLENGAPILALGGSGGTTIGPNVTQVLLSRLAVGLDPEAALARPRFMIPAPRTGQTLWLESELAKQHGEELVQRGELILAREPKFGAVQVIARQAGRFLAASDARKQGKAQAQNQ